MEAPYCGPRSLVEAAGVEPVPVHFITVDSARLPKMGLVPPRNLLPSPSRDSARRNGTRPRRAPDPRSGTADFAATVIIRLRHQICAVASCLVILNPPAPENYL